MYLLNCNQNCIFFFPIIWTVLTLYLFEDSILCINWADTTSITKSKKLGHIIFVLWSLPFPNYSYDHFLARHNPTPHSTWNILIEIWDGPEVMAFSFSVLTKPRLSWASGSTKQLRVPRSLPLVNNFALIIWTTYFMWQAFWVSDITILFWDNLEAILFLHSSVVINIC